MWSQSYQDDSRRVGDEDSKTMKANVFDGLPGRSQSLLMEPSITTDDAATMLLSTERSINAMNCAEYECQPQLIATDVA